MSYVVRHIPVPWERSDIPLAAIFVESWQQKLLLMFKKCALPRRIKVYYDDVDTIIARLDNEAKQRIDEAKLRIWFGNKSYPI